MFVRKLASIMLLPALLLPACGESAAPTIETTGDVTIVEPAPGAVFKQGDKIPVVLTLEGAKIIEEATKTVVADEGHVHVSLDGVILSLLAGLEFDLTELTEDPIEPGAHNLMVEFVAGNHAAFSPREIEYAAFTVLK